MTASPRRALITGVAGQDGVLLARLLLSKGYDVWGLTRALHDRAALLAEHAPATHIVTGDIRDSATVRQVLDSVKPHEIYNLAALSSVGRSWAAPVEVMQTNAIAVVELLEAVRELQQSMDETVRFFQASSAEMFGYPDCLVQDEATPLRPRSPYGVSKAAAHHVTSTYREAYGLFACTAILYNHESSLREPHFVTRKITKAVADIARGVTDHLELGNIDVTRDWGYAPDYVHAMWLMMQHDIPDDFVVATGQSHTLTQFIEAAFARAGIADWRPYVRHDEALVRPSDAPSLIGDSTKARKELGWLPTKEFGEIVAEMVDADLAEQG